MKKVGIAGLGKLGLSWSLILASKGFEVHGVDINSKNISSLKNGQLTIAEEGAWDLFNEFNHKMNFYNSFDEIEIDLDYIFIIVPTPSLKNNCFDSSYVIKALNNIDSFLLRTEYNSYTNIVITSTVMPGECERFLTLLSLDLQSFIKENKLGVCYNPEFIALGSVIENMLNPDFILIGSNSEKALNNLSDLYMTVNGEDIDIKDMSLVSAEITKISLNTFLTLKISFANTIGLLSEQFNNAEKFKICEAIGTDSRIGNKFMKPGLGFGGPCLPRDTRAFGECLKNKNMCSPLSDGAAEVNSIVKRHFSNLVNNGIKETKKNNQRILFSGITYKKNSWLLEESHAFKIVLNNKNTSNNIDIYDELADDIKKYSLIWPKYEMLFDSLDNNLERLISKSPNYIILFTEMNTKDYKLINDYIEDNSTKNPIEVVDIWKNKNLKFK